MTKLFVAHSQVKDGSMLNREDYGNAQVLAHRISWLESVGVDPTKTIRVCLSYDNQSDFCRYREIVSSDLPVTTADNANETADALVTTEVGRALFLPVADCIGAVLFDEEHGVLMLSHLGRHSLERGGGTKSVEYLIEHYKTDPKKITVWLSAAISKELYKIYALDNKGMKEALYQQLAAAGVNSDRITDTEHDTGKHADYYSYSEFLKGNKAENGRHAIVAMMTDEPV